MTNPHDSGRVMADWDHQVVPGDAARPALLMLHGTGGDEREMISLGRSLAPGAALVAPRGPVSEGGMARFFRRSPSDPFGFPDLPERIDDLAAFVRAAVLEHALGDRPLYAVGYSNGANAATALMVRHPGLLDGAVLLRGLLPTPVPESLDLSGVRVLAAPGRIDQLIPPAMAAELIDTLRGRGAEVTEAWSPGGHGLAQADLDAASAWIAQPA